MNKWVDEYMDERKKEWREREGKRREVEKEGEVVLISDSKMILDRC